MALDKLISRLEAEAQAEVDGLLEAARSQAAGLAASADERVRRRRTEAGQSRENRLNTAVSQGLIESRREARRTLLNGRHDLIRRVIDTAGPLLIGALELPGYRARLASWVSEALRCLGDQPGMVRGSPALVPELTRLAQGHPQVSVVEDSAIGAGFKAVTEGNTLVVDCTLEGRLQGLLPAVAIHLMARVESRQ
jgi:vacuolar-type H+-ATPase subunit E/Vma4